VAEPPIVDASPLIVLAHGGFFDLLRVAGDSVIVPLAVATEIGRRGPDDPTVLAMDAASQWIVVVLDPVVPPEILSWDLGRGESAVLALAYAKPGTEVICDDLAARRCAATLGIPVRGTLGLILLAKQRGVVDRARPILERLRSEGMYLSDHVMDRALRKVGE
jgi:predicted nucleic acid-binding protein